MHLNCVAGQPGWTEVYAVLLFGSLMRPLRENGSGIQAVNKIAGNKGAERL